MEYMRNIAPVNDIGKSEDNEYEDSRDFAPDSPYETMFTEYPEMMNTKQLCEALGCCEKYVYRLIREGKLPKLSGIRSVRVPKVYLINFVLQGAQESGE